MCRRKLLLSCVLISCARYSAAVEFNSEFLNIDDNEGVSLEKFARAQYTEPGNYLLDIAVNQRYFGTRSIEFRLSADGQGSFACLPEDLVAMFGLKPELLKTLPRLASGQCVDLGGIDNATVKYQQNLGRLTISLPQASLEYDDPSYIPPAAWSNGLDGALLDYRVIANHRETDASGDSTLLQSYGTAGLNIDAWRLRADYQAQQESGSQDSGMNNQGFQLNRLYAYRALPSIRSKLSVGEDYLNSDVFDTFALRGVSLSSDDRMLPPNLRGYAPLISGLARTNATVTVSQQGRVLYSTTVTPGAFSIQDLNSSVQGTLDVTVREEDGSEQTFTVNTAAVPFLSREGELRYKVSAGQPRLTGNGGQEPNFVASELAYGLPWNMTLYGGLLVAQDYLSSAVGVGKDLGAFGALSGDVTNSRATLPWNGQKVVGNSYRLNYSKRFDAIGTDLRFLGYRFSDRTFTNFSQFVGDPDSYSLNAGKQRYSVMLAKRFSWLSTSLSYDHSTYWDVAPTDRFGLSLARSFAAGKVKNINVNLSAYQTKNAQHNDSQIYLGVSIPLGGSSLLSSNVQRSSSGATSTSVGFSQDVGDGLSYQLYGGVGDNKYANAYVARRGSTYRANASATTDGSTYRSYTGEIDSSLVATRHGIAAHGNGSNGDTRLLVSTDGVPGVAFSGQARSNARGYAVMDGLPSFQAYEARVNMEQLPLDVDVSNPVQRLALTEGAIGYVNFAAGRGRNAYVALTQANGKAVPFGASVQDKQTHREVGIVGEEGVAYLLGAKAGAELVARWGDTGSCTLAELPAEAAVTNVAKPLPCR
ncbi:fimbria/pilus outer membrane usher protein [Pseudomonas nitroreducens]|uniref:fimbria/pilus outer membrane usher protein n=1 Tax=Pseudomonas nitroreducens TaxID=46680 RepID=UPI002658530E|nr:fimbria/pilus outer membrane usher protein [Pseudomonas nitroreducens]MCP1649816.1 outer membrane usher protein [Pseudomonas nitroreducens]MCP1687456.1 outer membrane usher protein [Pseudomonas nitroreducens]